MKRLFELAKELGVASKAIVAKCQAEGIPAIENHMSSVSAGLEATIREWFSGDTATHNAVEITEKVNIDEVRVATRSRAKSKTRREDESGESGGVGTIAPPDAPEADKAFEAAQTAPVEAPTKTDAPAETVRPAAATTAHAVAAPAEAPAAPESAPATAAAAAPAPVAPPAAPASPAAPSGPPAQAASRVIRPTPVEPAAPAAPSAPAPTRQQPGQGPARPAEPLRPAALSPQRPGGPGGPGPGSGGGPGSGTRPPARPMAPGGPSRDGPPPRMNVPDRPRVVSPVGPKLEVQTPAKLAGPKVVRIEAAETIEVPRARRPMGDSGVGTSRPARGGAGVGPAPGGPPMSEEERNRRNKRRVGGPAEAPGRAGARRSGKADVEPGEWTEQDLLEREARLSRSEGFLRQRRRDQKLKDQAHRSHASTPAQIGGRVAIAAPFTIKDLSSATGVKAAEIVKKLFIKGVMATANSGIDPEQAQEIMFDFNIELEVVEAKTAEAEVFDEFASRDSIDERMRAPVVTILGHVDHGKTSLLDKIRNTNIAAGEAGGITQSTRAFRVSVKVEGEDKPITFLDTPGHEAFSEMRARGANMTDVVVLVVSAVDGVMPQTIESIKHAQAAKVPVVVALNKIDVPGIADSQIQQIFGKLAEQGLSPVEWGGNTEVVRTSAITGRGVDDLLTVLDLQAQVLELKADFKGPARGTVIEAKMEEGRGSTAQLLVQNGELHVGDIIVAGRAHGRVRDITDDRGRRVPKAEPSTPVLISGLDVLPDAGDRFFVVDTLRKAQEAAEHRQSEERMRELAQPKVTLDSMFAAMKEKESDLKELLLVVKADVQGSVDVIKHAVEKVSTSAVKVRVLYAAAGGITESDVNLAAASGAVIMGFNVIANSKARQAAEQKAVEIRSYQVIYDIVDDVKKAAEGLLTPELKLEVLGHAEVRQVFKVSKVGSIAGCYITDGVIERNALIRVTRNGIVIESDRVLDQLKRFKDDVKEVKSGMECGMKIVGYDDIKSGDVLECYRKVEVRRTL
ncbi:MAG: translation initiation factor IF-2 [Planctomycetota bacterium]|nr:translation initiation factor IF-2 [Planctomycetota bacterium]